MPTALSGHEFWPHGREPQSMAFLIAAGNERLCSGDTNRMPRASAICCLSLAAGAGRLFSLSWL
ncbi:hypothetical protein D3C81_2132380 [compost metagenome]